MSRSDPMTRLFNENYPRWREVVTAGVVAETFSLLCDAANSIRQSKKEVLRLSALGRTDLHLNTETNNFDYLHGIFSVSLTSFSLLTNSSRHDDIFLFFVLHIKKLRYQKIFIY